MKTNEKIIQFGTGNFLRGFADCFTDSLIKQGLFDGSTVIVSPTNSKTVEKLNAQSGKYGLLVRGIKDGKEVNGYTEISCISRAVNPYTDFDGFISLALLPEVRFIISNTTEAGIRFDSACKFEDAPAASFPGKLTQLLYKRFSAGLGGVVVFACELIDNNGDELKKCVLRYADMWQFGEAFKNWIEKENRFCNTLVDRIVTGFPAAEAEQIFEKTGHRDCLLDTAEPYHLWVIEGDFENELPLKKGGVNVIWTNNCAPYKKMKVRILNGSHTLMCFPSLLCGMETVGESLKDGLMNEFLQRCLFGYILPMLGETEENRSFANAVLERFENPFIRHEWRSISLNSVSKFTARVLPTVNDLKERTGSVPAPFALSLACLIKYYREYEPSDAPDAVNFIGNEPLFTVLKNSGLWGEDISYLSGNVSECLTRIERDGIREAIRWSLS